MFLRFSHFVACNRLLFLFNTVPFWYIPHFVYLLVGGYLGCFQFGAVGNTAMVDVHVSLYEDNFISLKLKPKSTITGLYDNYIFTFIRHCQPLKNFFVLDIPFYIPTRIVWMIWFLCILAST